MQALEHEDDAVRLVSFLALNRIPISCEGVRGTLRVGVIGGEASPPTFAFVTSFTE